MTKEVFDAERALQATKNLPPFEYKDDPVIEPISVTLNIAKQGSHYDLKILTWDRRKSATIYLTSQELANLNERLRELMEAASSRDVDVEEHDSEKLEESLLPLAEEAHYAFNKIFEDPDALETIERLMSMGPLFIEIDSDDFFFPWELMLPVDPLRPRFYDHFWGVKHIVYRNMTIEARPGDFVMPTILYESSPRLGLLYDRLLHNVAHKEVPFFEGLESDGKILLSKLEELASDQRQEGLETFREFWSNTFDVAHLACHAVCDEGAPDRSYIRLSDDFTITIAEIVRTRLEMNGYPLVILNACEAGNLNPVYSSHFVQELIRRGPRGIVATECAVPDLFAAHFTERLYGCLIDEGIDLGESMRITRKYFLESCNNPTGLLYSMYAWPKIKLARARRPDERP